MKTAMNEQRDERVVLTPAVYSIYLSRIMVERRRERVPSLGIARDEKG